MFSLLSKELTLIFLFTMGKKCCIHSSVFIFDWLFFSLAGNKDNHILSKEFEIQRDPTTNCKVIRPLAFAKTSSIDLKWEKCFDHSSAFTFNWIFFVLASKEHIYKSFDENETSMQ